MRRHDSKTELNISARVGLWDTALKFLSPGPRNDVTDHLAEWSPIQSVIIRVITKLDDRAAGGRFVYHEYDYRLNWTTRSPIIN